MPNKEKKEQIIKVIDIFFPEAKIYLFGSRARGDYVATSDIDIAIDAKDPLSMTQKGQIVSMIDALNIPQKVDVVDLNRIPHCSKRKYHERGNFVERLVCAHQKFLKSLNALEKTK